MSDYLGPAAGTSTLTFNPSDYCANRLPCGICRILHTACPLAVKPYDVTWKNPYEVTCKAEVQE